MCIIVVFNLLQTHYQAHGNRAHSESQKFGNVPCSVMPGLHFKKSSFISSLSTLALKLNLCSHHGVLFLFPPLFTHFWTVSPKLEMTCLWSFLFQVRQETCMFPFKDTGGCCYNIFHCDTSFVHENMEDSSLTVCPTCLCSDCKIYIYICGTLSLKLELSLA